MSSRIPVAGVTLADASSVGVASVDSSEGDEAVADGDGLPSDVVDGSSSLQPASARTTPASAAAVQARERTDRDAEPDTGASWWSENVVLNLNQPGPCRNAVGLRADPEVLPARQRGRWPYEGLLGQVDASFGGR
jgi:hypothetical protein